jgi:dolichyl-phosphate-mannose-protein mannosyltransferase
MQALKRYRAPWVFAISVLLLLFNLSHAPMMFDEGVYVGAAREFLTGAPSSNPEHPPLAKYFIAASIKIFGDTPFGWRFPSTLAGGLVAVAVFGITWRLTRNTRTAAIAWLLTVAGGFWFVMSRIAMLPVYQLAFELTGAWIFLIASELVASDNRSPTGSLASTKDGSMKMFALSGVFFGLSMGCRWGGVVGLIACLIVAILGRARIKSVVLMLASAFAAYFATWVPLLLRERRPLTDFVAANQFILHFHTHMNIDPRLGEPWWTWFLRVEPKQSLSHLVANPVVGVLGLLAIVALLCRRNPSKGYILSLLYLGHVGQWAIGVRQLTFYYHYFEAFIVLGAALAIAMQGLEWRKLRADVVVTALALMFFAYWYPTWANLPEPYNLLMGAH